MSSTFTPSDAIDMNKEKDWPYQLALLDWDTTRIAFTKRQLIDFLKYAGVTVDTNLTNIQKLPRYAQFGKLSAGAAPTADSSEPLATAKAVSPAPPPTVPSSSGFIPTRRVREAPGGFQTDIFGSGEEEPRPAPPRARQNPPEEVVEEEAKPAQAAQQPVAAGYDRNASTLTNMFSDSSNQGAFKPTRRVRDAPGGHDQLHDMFS